MKSGRTFVQECLRHLLLVSRPLTSLDSAAGGTLVLARERSLGFALTWLTGGTSSAPPDPTTVRPCHITPGSADLLSCGSAACGFAAMPDGTSPTVLS